VICLAEGNPAATLGAVQDVLGGTAPIMGYVTVVGARLLAGGQLTRERHHQNQVTAAHFDAA